MTTCCILLVSHLAALLLGFSIGRKPPPVYIRYTRCVDLTPSRN